MSPASGAQMTGEQVVGVSQSQTAGRLAKSAQDVAARSIFPAMKTPDRMPVRISMRGQFIEGGVEMTGLERQLRLDVLDVGSGDLNGALHVLF